jgi:hypothetical protein
MAMPYCSQEYVFAHHVDQLPRQVVLELDAQTCTDDELADVLALRGFSHCDTCTIGSVQRFKQRLHTRPEPI